MYIHMYTYTYTYIHIHIHTYMYIHNKGEAFKYAKPDEFLMKLREGRCLINV